MSPGSFVPRPKVNSALVYFEILKKPRFDHYQARLKLIIDAANYLAEYAPVDIVIVQGNHDFERMFYAGEVLSAWFKNDKDVFKK